MTRFVFSTAMSLDGFTAGAGGDMSWLSEHLGSADVDTDALVATIGALLIGRRTFGGDDPNKGTDREGPFGGRWKGLSVVLTHKPPAESSTGDDVAFATDLDTAVGLARDAAGGKDVHILGASVAKQCLEAGVLDEIVVFVVPALLGDGTRLFDHPGGTNVRLKPLDPRPFAPGGLRFGVVR